MATLDIEDPRHGTINGYTNYDCRCAACKEKFSRYQVAKGHDRRSDGLPAGDKRHGTDNGYTNYGCRCGPCTVARATLRTRRRAPQEA